jgi:hypothetical protein
MMPWERDIYVSLLVSHIKEENEKRKRDSKWVHRIKKQILILSGGLLWAGYI